MADLNKSIGKGTIKKIPNRSTNPFKDTKASKASTVKGTKKAKKAADTPKATRKTAAASAETEAFPINGSATTRLLSVVGVGIENARTAQTLIKRAGIKMSEFRNAIGNAQVARGQYILQVRGKYFLPKDSEEFGKYIWRQSDAAGNPPREYR